MLLLNEKNKQNADVHVRLFIYGFWNGGIKKMITITITFILGNLETLIIDVNLIITLPFKLAYLYVWRGLKKQRMLNYSPQLFLIKHFFLI
jgi:hypothetical protein